MSPRSRNIDFDGCSHVLPGQKCVFLQKTRDTLYWERTTAVRPESVRRTWRRRVRTVRRMRGLFPARRDESRRQITREVKGHEGNSRGDEILGRVDRVERVLLL